MNIIDLRKKDVPVSDKSNFEGVTTELRSYLEIVIPKEINSESSGIVKTINNLVWQKGIPIFLVNEDQMPEEYKNFEPKLNEKPLQNI